MVWIFQRKFAFWAITLYLKWGVLKYAKMIVKFYMPSSTFILTAQMGGCEVLMPKSSLWSEMPSLKNMTSSLTPTAGGMIIKPFASPALGVFLLSIAKGQLVGWLVPQAQSKAREVPTSILTICHITWRRTNLAARHWHYLFTSQQCGFHVGTVWDGLSSLWIKNQHMRIVRVENTSRKANNTHFRL